MAYLQIKNFNKSFGDVEVLKGIDLDVEKGQVVTVIGSSGSGKTTLLRCINFLETPDAGEMILDGETLFSGENLEEKESVLREKRLNFGLVFQSFNLFPQFTVIENVKLAPELLVKAKAKEYKKQLIKQAKFSRLALKKVVKEYVAEEKAKIEKSAELLLKKVGLTDKKNAYPGELSGGQQQRVAIARALALNPKILCFDEPTSALDPELTGEVLKVIKSLKSKDSTMIIVTHEMGFAKKVSDKVVFMHEGVIAESGTAKEIFDYPKSEELKSFLKNINEKDGE